MHSIVLGVFHYTLLVAFILCLYIVIVVSLYCFQSSLLVNMLATAFYALCLLSVHQLTLRSYWNVQIAALSFLVQVSHIVKLYEKIFCSYNYMPALL